jgi:hypothetical protein
LVGQLKRTTTFEWNASTWFVGNGKLAAASELKTGERANVNNARSSASRSGSRSRRGARRRVLTRLHSTLALRERQLPRAAIERPRPVPLYSVVKNGSKAAPYLGG